MNLFSKLSITRLLKLTGIILTVLLVLVIGNVVLLLDTFEQERKIVNQESKYKELGRELIATHNYVTEQVRKFAQEGKMEYYDKYMKEVKEKQRRKEIRQQLKEMGMSEAERKLIAESSEEAKATARIEQQAIKLIKEGTEKTRYREQNFKRARELIYGGYYNKHREQAMQAVDKFITKMEKRIETKTKQIRSKANLFAKITFGLVALTLVTIILIFILLYRKISIPIQNAVDFADEIAEGNLDVTPLIVNSEDEVARLSERLNQMRHSLEEMLGNVLGIIKNLSAYSEEISKVDDKIKHVFEIIKEVKAGNKETSEAIEEISGGITEIANRTEKLTTKAKKISEIGTETLELVKKTDDKINLGNQLVDQAVEIIKELDDSVDKVEKMSDKIMEIADQINYLSLVGAVESAEEARDEHEFGQVADEIKELADESMEAAEEVKKITDEVKEVTEKTVNIMIPKQGTEENIANVFAEIQNLSDEVLAAIKEVYEATGEQVVVSEQISSSVEKISTSSTEVSGRTDDLYKNSKELEEIASQVHQFNENLCQEFTNQTQEAKQKLKEINLETDEKPS